MHDKLRQREAAANRSQAQAEEKRLRRRARSFFQIKFQRAARAGLDVFHDHGLHLILSVDLLKIFGIKIFEFFAPRVVGVSLDDAERILVNPAHHARIAVGGG